MNLQPFAFHLLFGLFLCGEIVFCGSPYFFVLRRR